MWGKRNKLLSLLLTAALLAGLAACGNKPRDPIGAGAQEGTFFGGKTAEETTAAEASAESGEPDTEAAETEPPETEQPETESPETTPAESQPEGAEPGGSVTPEEIEAQRPQLEEETPMGDAGTWTIFVYLCGSDLESDPAYGGAASYDLLEMADAKPCDRVRFVVQTGGAMDWSISEIDPKRTQRFVAEDGELSLVYDEPASNMGESKTLADFLLWGVENYSADNMGVILWNHGGGSITGVCFDETSYYDSLSLSEMDAAFRTVFEKMTSRFTFIGFDACLMATVEMANIAASYADYMIASQETEPGTGWDYTTMGDYLADHPEADGESFGRVICNTFYSHCAQYGLEDSATLALIDLSRINEVIAAFNTFAESMYTNSSEVEILSSMVRGIVSAENYGGNNTVDGYTNMVDLAGLISACADWSSGSEEALEALRSAVIFQVNGADHPEACGLSLYYPLEVQGSEELKMFASVCVSPYYLSFVDRQGQGGAYSADPSDYDDDWNDDEDWSWIDDLFYNDDTGQYEAEEGDDDHWDYLDDYEVTGNSPFVHFAEEPAIDENGTYGFTLDEESLAYTASVTALVCEESEDGNDLIILGETMDVWSDYDTGRFEDEFDGYWLSLPDGQNLCVYAAEYSDDFIIYSSPVMVNGEETSLRIRQDSDGIKVEGVWGGITEYGASAGDVYPLEEGDVIIPLYDSYNLLTDEFEQYIGWEYTFNGELSIHYDLMEPQTYYYAFSINDIYGDYFITDYAVFSIEEDGSIYFEEELI